MPKGKPTRGRGAKNTREINETYIVRNDDDLNISEESNTQSSPGLNDNSMDTSINSNEVNGDSNLEDDNLHEDSRNESNCDEGSLNEDSPDAEISGQDDDDNNSVNNIDLVTDSNDESDGTEFSEEIKFPSLPSITYSMKKVTPKKASSKKGITKKVTSKKTTSKKATPKKATPKKATPKKATPKKATPKKATTKKPTVKKDTPKKALFKKSTKKDLAGKATPKKTIPKSITPRKTIKQLTPKRSTPRKVTPKELSRTDKVLKGTKPVVDQKRSLLTCEQKIMKVMENNKKPMGWLAIRRRVIESEIANNDRSPTRAMLAATKRAMSKAINKEIVVRTKASTDASGLLGKFTLQQKKADPKSVKTEAPSEKAKKKFKLATADKGKKKTSK